MTLFSPICLVLPRLDTFGAIWPFFGPVRLHLAPFGPVWPHRINLYERKGLEGTPKDYLLGIDRRIKEGLREKLGLHPYQEGHCYRGISMTQR